jgi:hypothetical protein
VQGHVPPQGNQTDKQKKNAAELEEMMKVRMGAGDFRMTVVIPNRMARHDLRAAPGGGPSLPVMADTIVTQLSPATTI